MKVCPKCNSSYSDETLEFCLTDGTPLVSGASVVNPTEAETISDKAPVTSEKVTATSSKVDVKKGGPPSNTSKSRNYIILAAALAILGVGGYWLLAHKVSSPTESYKGLYAAVKSKDTEAIKKWMSKSTLGFAEMVSKQQNTPIEKVFENGFTATTFAASIPEMRDERIKDNMGALEVWNSKDQRWEDLPFIKEEDGWKLAIGDLFAGTYQKPAPGSAEKQAEEANKMSNNIIQAPAANMNANGNFKPPKLGKNPVPMPPASNKPSQKANTNTMMMGNTNPR